MAVKDIFEAVLEYSGEKVQTLVAKEIEDGTDVNIILDEGLIGALDEVGARFSSGELFVPEMLMSAEVMKMGLAILKPHLSADLAQTKGTVVIGTVKGDLHDIGKNLVTMMLEGAGFNVIDLGVDVEPARFVKTAEEKGAQVVALSALLTTTMTAMEQTVKSFKESGLAVRVIVGGAPVSKDFAEKIGADGFSETAPGAVELTRSLLAA